MVFGPSTPFCPLKLLKVDTHGDGLLLLGGTWNRVQQYWAPCESAGSGLLPLCRGGEQVRGLVEVQDAGGDWSFEMVSPRRLHLEVVIDLTDFWWLPLAAIDENISTAGWTKGRIKQNLTKPQIGSNWCFFATIFTLSVGRAGSNTTGSLNHFKETHPWRTSRKFIFAASSQPDANTSQTSWHSLYVNVSKDRFKLFVLHQGCQTQFSSWANSGRSVDKFAGLV